MSQIAKAMPQGLEYRIAYDPTQFVRASIDSVVHTLLEAIALVVLVVILFLQTWRASIIPLLRGACLHHRDLRRHAAVWLLPQCVDPVWAGVGDRNSGG